METIQKEIRTTDVIEVPMELPAYFHQKDGPLDCFIQVAKDKRMNIVKFFQDKPWAVTFEMPFDMVKSDWQEITEEEWCDKLGDIATAMDAILMEIEKNKDCKLIKSETND